MSEEKSAEKKTVQTTWGAIFKSSIKTGLIIAVIWVTLMLVTGSYNPSTAEGMSGLLGNSVFWLIFGATITFVIKAIWHSVRKQIVPSGPIQADATESDATESRLKSRIENNS
ncbi:MAG: hypothetical protein OEQ39_15870 [Gammaproteobacteria bacterium]|nr:hypothetical protein [Gammaproteobacteria bacterium]